jgi:hypothetical protein
MTSRAFNVLVDMGGTGVRLRDTLSTTPRLLAFFSVSQMSRVLPNFLMSSQVHFETTSPGAICRRPQYLGIVNQSATKKRVAREIEQNQDSYRSGGGVESESANQ